MDTFDEARGLIRRLPEPLQRELAAWLTESLEDAGASQSQPLGMVRQPRGEKHP